MSVGVVGFVINVVVVVGVAVVGVGSAASCVGDMVQRHGSGGDGVRGLKVERERELRDCESSEKNIYIYIYIYIIFSSQLQCTSIDKCTL